jgi:hypothetical protein
MIIDEEQHQSVFLDMLDFCLLQVKHDPVISARILANIEKQDPAVF